MYIHGMCLYNEITCDCYVCSNSSHCCNKCRCWRGWFGYGGRGPFLSPYHWGVPWPQAQTQSRPWERHGPINGPQASRATTLAKLRAGQGRAWQGRAHEGGRRQALGQCPGSFWAGSVKDPSDSKSHRLNVDIFRLCYIHLRYILWNPLKWSVNFF